MVSPLQLVAGAAGTAVAWGIFSVATRLRTNIAKARKTGLPYLVVPIQPFSLFWQLTFTAWVPLIKMFPKSWWEEWLFVMLPNTSYNNLYAPYERMGDSFIIVSFDGMIMNTASAEVISQITSRREDFPKPVEIYTILDVFGTNVVTTEGAVWRMHRKVTAAGFSEKNAAHTFAEAISQAQSMLAQWFPAERANATSSATLRSLEMDTMSLALNIIGFVGFGLRFLWPGETVVSGTDAKAAKYVGREPPPGFTQSFVGATSMLMHNLLPLTILPDWLLRVLPFKFAREAAESKKNWVQYMEDFLQDKIAEVRAGDNTGREGMDILGQLVRAKYGSGGKGGEASSWMTDANIIGNAFVMFVAGHETTANTLHFTLLQLATNPAAQRKLQRDVDALVGDSDPATWDYEANVNAMLASHLGACTNETLRVLPAVVEIPKRVSRSADQTIVQNGVRHVLPAGMQIALVAVCAARNPHFWPSRPSRISGKPTDLDDYVPERWYRKSEGGTQQENSQEEEEDFGGYRGSDTSAALYRPVRGSFIPFSDGARSCLGRRIALVELMAALAVIFQRYSVELAVDEWASDEEVARMGDDERRKLYEVARERSRATIREATTLITLKLNGGKHVPVRVVKRGTERFVNRVDL